MADGGREVLCDARRGTVTITRAEGRMKISTMPAKQGEREMSDMESGDGVMSLAEQGGRVTSKVKQEGAVTS